MYQIRIGDSFKFNLKTSHLRGGMDGVYTLNELQTHITLSKTNQAKLLKLRQGCALDVAYDSLDTRRYIYRLTDDDLSQLQQMDQLELEYADIRAEIKKLIPDELDKKKLELEKKMRKLRSEMLI